jgi:hypothetical protein
MELRKRIDHHGLVVDLYARRIGLGRVVLDFGLSSFGGRFRFRRFVFIARNQLSYIQRLVAYWMKEQLSP